MATSAGDDDLPIAVRRKRRSSFGFTSLKESHLAHASAYRTEGMETLPLTPVRKKKKRVRFSDLGPSTLADDLSTGLTPAVQRTLLGSKAKKPNRRHSTPTTSWNLDINESPMSGTRQFAPLRQVLDGRVKRRLRRNGLSEEINNIESSRKTKEKCRLAELERLKSALQNKDREMQSMRDEWDLRSQFGDEVGNSQGSQLSDKVRELESQISALKTELQHREVEPSTMNDDPDWSFAARDPFHDYDDHDDDDEPMPHYDNDFDDSTNMNDIIASTPTRRSFPSPPSTLPDTTNIPNDPLYDSQSQATATTQADFVDPEKEEMQQQLSVLQVNLDELSAAMEMEKDYQSRLSSKLSTFMPLESSTSDPSHLDAALDTLLTRLALSQSSLTETNAILDALRTEIKNLGFSPASPADEIITLIASQFRQARLDLEYLNPGEIATGFENQTLLSLLIGRVKTLLGQITERDADIEQYREQELSLRQQLEAQVGGLKIVQKDLADARIELKGLNEELSWQTGSNEKLKKALEGYRQEVKGLEDLVGRMETSESQLKGDLEAAVRRADGLEADVESYKTERQASRAAAEENELLRKELETKLETALKTIETLKMEIKAAVFKNEAEIAQLKEDRDKEIEALKILNNQREDEKEEDFIADIAAREQRVEELSAKFEGLRHALGAANSMVEILEGEKTELETRIRNERGRANAVVMVMREQLKNALNVGSGFLEQSDNEEELQAATIEIVKPGKFLNGELARRRSSGGALSLPMKKKSKRRKYDSGLGFLDEEEEQEEEEVGIEARSEGHWMSEGNETMEM